MMRRILFLDFDGVLNTEKYQSKLRNAGLPTWDEFGPLFDPEAIENLQMILDNTGADIVISSTWKIEGPEKVYRMWKKRGLPGNVIGCTPDVALEIDLDAMDFDDPNTFMNLSGKGNEVNQWLKENSLDNCKYAILDDLPDFLPEQENHLIYTDPRKGITLENAILAIKILSEH